MAQTIEAVYEQGVFKPLQPVQLTEGQKVTLSVEAEKQRLMSDSKQTVRLGGLWRGVSISEEDVAEARREMWGKFGEDEA